jgi:hypothetical protein
MGFAALHIQKPKGNDARTAAHIERTVQPANADPDRTRLNENLIAYPNGVETRTQAIQHRIENAGIKRKISHNQIRALRVILSGTPEDKLFLSLNGKDIIDWFKQKYQELKLSARPHIRPVQKPQIDKNKGVKR